MPLEFSGKQSLVEWSWVPTDDGRFAIVQVSSLDKKALAVLLTDKAIVQSFSKGKDGKNSIETELKKLKKDFSLDPIQDPKRIGK